VTRTLTTQDAEAGLIATSHPSAFPLRYVFRPHTQASHARETTIWATINDLIHLLKAPDLIIAIHPMARKNDDTILEVVHVDIDLSFPVGKNDVESFVRQCSEILASHQLGDTVVEVNHCRWWGSLAPRR